MAAHEKRTKKDESFSTLQDEVKGLKSDISDIKRLLHIIATEIKKMTVDVLKQWTNQNCLSNSKHVIRIYW